MITTLQSKYIHLEKKLILTKYPVLLLCVGLLFGACQSEKLLVQEVPTDENPTYQNPILAGFYPDLTICRAGDKFYMTNSTFS